MESLLPLAALFVAGLVSGTINVLAGGGSFLTLPVLIFYGLPAGVANGTNRLSILMQNLSAVPTFRRHGVLSFADLTWSALPASAGAVAGAWLALRVADDDFRRTLAILMVVVTLASLWRPRTRTGVDALPRPALAAIFFAIGIYGGFIQAGVGFLLLAGTTAAGLDLVRGNALKVATVLCFTILPLAIFAVGGKVVLLPGLVLGAGSLLGGWAGARLTILKGHAWLRAVVTVTIVIFAVKLWFFP